MQMRSNAELAADLATLARLHAALDSVVEIQQVIAAIRDTSPSHAQAVVRVGALLGEARELLRGLLVRPDRRHALAAADSLALGRSGS